ncbi:hypothetical protein SAMN04515678_103189 [Roseivivax sediminis]|uniref:Uncharacterized protein n=1 Tax=Roseivivax sediminis TaxID=936889 RepID=A0A1I1VH47_9RHOB|nr:hypothetical protein SAMN04515678_103189 [Roseivivax sediminis]
MPWQSWTAVALASFVPAAGMIGRRSGLRSWAPALVPTVSAIGFGLAGIFT